MVFFIAFRNLFRQKQRNFLLGLAIAVGTAFLLTASAFSKGISHTLFERVVVLVVGHVNVAVAERGRPMMQVLRGGKPLVEKVAAVPHVRKVEESLGIFCRAIGNGRSDNLIMVAIDLEQEFNAQEQEMMQDNFPMLEGEISSLRSSAMDYPIIISKPKADYLRVGMGDVVRVRFQDINGAWQAARLEVAGIFQPSNIFMEAPVFLELSRLRELLGYGPLDIPQLYLTVEDPVRNAVKVADSIYSLLQPDLALVEVNLQRENENLMTAAVLGGFRSDSLSLQHLLSGRDKLPEQAESDGNLQAWSRRGIMIPYALGRAMNWKVGDTLILQHPLRVGKEQARLRLLIAGFWEPLPGMPKDLMLMHEVLFYDHYLLNLPPLPSPELLAQVAHNQAAPLATQWNLMPRSRSSDELRRSVRELSQGKYKGSAIDVRTMYESASDILKLENALQIITLSAVLVLFLIILVGVVNTLRMTIRERTREIGTMRAIGMQSRQVLQVFMWETFLLALGATLMGVLLAHGAMALLGSITFVTVGNPLGVILVRGQVQFAPTVQDTLFYIALIVIMALLTAFAPARRAAALQPTEALRHHD